MKPIKLFVTSLSFLLIFLLLYCRPNRNARYEDSRLFGMEADMVMADKIEVEPPFN